MIKSPQRRYSDTVTKSLDPKLREFDVCTNGKEAKDLRKMGLYIDRRSLDVLFEKKVQLARTMINQNGSFQISVESPKLHIVLSLNGTMSAYLITVRALLGLSMHVLSLELLA